MIERIASLSASFEARYPRYHKTGRFLISGGLAAGTNLTLLYILTDWFGIWYLISSAIAFGVAFCISFTLQKFWTFQDRSREEMHFQAGLFFMFALINLGLNTICLYYLVEFTRLHYLVAQIIVSIFIAIENYFIYQRLIFRPRL